MGNSLSQLSEESTLSATPTSSTIANKLPDEILFEILFRVPLQDLPSILFVCRKLSKLVSDRNFLCLRLLPTLHVFNFFTGCSSLSSASAPLNTSHWSPTTEHELPSFGEYPRVSFVPLGRSVYIICRQTACRYDTWTKSISPMARTLFPCDVCSPAAINGKIYVRGNARRSFIEEYDPVVDNWRVVASHASKEDGRREGVGAGEIFYLLDPFNSGSMQGYDVSSRQWVEGMPAMLPRRTGFVVGACGTPTGHVYIMTNRGMDLRFWRWEGIGKDWMELEAPTGIVEEWLALNVLVLPVVTEQIGLLWASVRVSCVAVKDETVVAVVNVSHRRGRDRQPGSSTGWYVLIYNVADGSWSRGFDLPFGLRYDPSLVFTEY